MTFKPASVGTNGIRPRYMQSLRMESLLVGVGVRSQEDRVRRNGNYRGGSRKNCP
ncbi:MAG: hypothetical protein F6K17_27485 [Okeania sp. SIO3C4]|nr:hypothetical protein [Okeania sp. SIO3C4]